jgi:hypothetical protein
MIEDGSCNFAPPAFNADDDVCARIDVFDMAGHRSAESREVCTRALACAAQVNSACSIVDACVPPSSTDAGPGDAGPSEAGSSDASTEGGSSTPPDPSPTVDGRDGGCSLTRSVPHGASVFERLGIFAAVVAVVRRRRRATTA